MTFDSSTETVAILYDIENAPFEMLDYTLGKARKYLPCRMIVASDWEKRPEQKCWDRLMRREGFTFRQIERKIDGKNSLDYALFDAAIMLRDEGVRKFFIITTDSDFVKIVEILREGDTDPYIIGVGTKQASQVLRDAYDQFLCYPPESKKKVQETVKKPKAVAKKSSETVKNTKAVVKKSQEVTKKAKAVTKKSQSEAKKAKEVEDEKNIEVKKIKSTTKKIRAKKEIIDAVPEGYIQIKLPQTLHKQLVQKMKEEQVDMDQLITYLLMKGLV